MEEEVVDTDHQAVPLRNQLVVLAVELHQQNSNN
jgi:hypothetical protein